MAYFHPARSRFGCTIQSTFECANIDVYPIHTQRIPLQDLPQIFRRRIFEQSAPLRSPNVLLRRHSYIVERVQYGQIVCLGQKQWRKKSLQTLPHLLLQGGPNEMDHDSYPISEMYDNNNPLNIYKCEKSLAMKYSRAAHMNFHMGLRNSACICIILYILETQIKCK